MDSIPQGLSLDELALCAERMGRAHWHQASDAAQIVASYLRCHPRVVELRYPGLRGDPLFEEAACTLESGFGPYVWYRTSEVWERLSCGDVDPFDQIAQLERILA